MVQDTNGGMICSIRLKRHYPTWVSQLNLIRMELMLLDYKMSPCMQHGVAMMDHGMTMNCLIQVLIRQMVVGRQGHDIGMVSVHRFHLVSNGGGLGKPKPNGMEMLRWRGV